MWTVTRHSGRSSDKRRIAMCGTEEDARKFYAKMKLDIVLGDVALVNAAGEIVESYSAPHVRAILV